MSFTSLLIHTCDIGLLSQGFPRDDYGRLTEVWSTATYTAQPCRLVATRGREVKIGAEVVVSDWKLFVANTVAVDEQDRISNVKLASTAVVLPESATFEIILVQLRSDGLTGHHKELALRKVE